MGCNNRWVKFSAIHLLTAHLSSQLFTKGVFVIKRKDERDSDID